jgi:hypothetical protein
MTTRVGWVYDGIHFARTRDINGHERHFVDGKPTARGAWLEAREAAIKVDPEGKIKRKPKDTARTSLRLASR